MFAIERTMSDDAEDAGRLEVDHLGVKGRICADHWTDADAMVFCTSIHYAGGLAYVHSHKNEYTDGETVSDFPLFSFVGVLFINCESFFLLLFYLCFVYKL